MVPLVSTAAFLHENKSCPKLGFVYIKESELDFVSTFKIRCVGCKSDGQVISDVEKTDEFQTRKMKTLQNGKRMQRGR